MRSEIKVGDLVQVIKPNFCGCNGSVGRIASVIRIRISRDIARCTKCKSLKRTGKILLADLNNGKTHAIHRLKKIEPLKDDDVIKSIRMFKLDNELEKTSKHFQKVLKLNFPVLPMSDKPIKLGESWFEQEMKSIQNLLWKSSKK